MNYEPVQISIDMMGSQSNVYTWSIEEFKDKKDNKNIAHK